MLERSPRVTRIAEGSGEGVTGVGPESPQSHVWRGLQRDSMVTQRLKSRFRTRQSRPKRVDRMWPGGVRVREGLGRVSLPLTVCQTKTRPYNRCPILESRSIPMGALDPLRA